MAAGIIDLTDQSFDEQIKSATEPVLVDFWAEWCGPCKALAPILEEVADEMAGRVKIAKVNIDDALNISRRFEVMSIPTLILFDNGEPVWRTMGGRSKSSLIAELEPHLASSSAA